MTLFLQQEPDHIVPSFLHLSILRSQLPKSESFQKHFQNYFDQDATSELKIKNFAIGWHQIDENISFRWSFGPLSAWGSIESTIILTTHPSLDGRFCAISDENTCHEFPVIVVHLIRRSVPFVLISFHCHIIQFIIWRSIFAIIWNDSKKLCFKNCFDRWLLFSWW